MNHVRSVGLAVFANIGHVKAFRQVEVKLNGRALPRAANNIFNFHIDLRAVESSAAFVDTVELQHVQQRR